MTTSARWNSFDTRPDDIIVCTSYKAGTTWTQMICALLVHQTPDLPRPLAELSPWLDLRVAPIEEIKRLYDTQSWRRVVKTHTPLDGLNYRQDVSYIICGRYPRDVFLSMQGHLENINMEVVGQALAAQGIPLEPPPPMPEDVSERFNIWMQASSLDWEQDGVPLWSHFRHTQTFWEFRHLPNMLFLHYADLKTDLEGQIRRVAKFLGVDVPEERWPILVKAATFEDMKANADSRAPDTNFGVYHSNDQFFKKGTTANGRACYRLKAWRFTRTLSAPATATNWSTGWRRARSRRAIRRSVSKQLKNFLAALKRHHSTGSG